MRKTFITAAAVAAIASMAPITAQNAPKLPGSMDSSKITGGIYNTDPAHTLIGFTVDHFGFNDYFGIFGDSTGTLTIDPKKPQNAKVDITIPVSKMTIASEALAKHMSNADFFEVEKYPDARFISTKVTVKDKNALIEGNLTLKDITKPVVLEAGFTGTGINPFNKKETIGFQALTTIKRSDFGIKTALPLVSDEVGLSISVAFEKG